jgi:hypothetical protein
LGVPEGESSPLGIFHILKKDERGFGFKEIHSKMDIVRRE